MISALVDKNVRNFHDVDKCMAANIAIFVNAQVNMQSVRRRDTSI